MARYASSLVSGTGGDVSFAISNDSGAYLFTLTNPASSPKRLKIYDFIVGNACASVSTDTDFSYRWMWFRHSLALGSSSALSEIQLDPGDPAATGIATRFGFGAQGAGPVMSVPLNVRFAFRWATTKDGAMIVPAVADNGLLLRAEKDVSLPFVSGVRMSGTVFWEE